MNPFVLVDNCFQKLPDSMKETPWAVTEHGRKVLETEDELNAYIAAYGEMHILKCRAALQNFPFSDLELYPFEIFDWGCGQGLATITLLDMLSERRVLSRLRKITLIEPSSQALNRATEWASRFSGPGVKVVAVNKYIPQNEDSTLDEVFCNTRISINLFSNILDIRSLNLSWLAHKCASLGAMNYMVCTGPKFTQNTNTRISDFCGYFSPSSYYTTIDRYPYAYTSRTHHPFGCEARCFLHESTKLINENYIECAETYQETDVYDFDVECLKSVLPTSTLDFYQKLRRFCGSFYDIYYNPSISCDSVDFVLASKSKGIILINVCDEISDLEADFHRIETIKENIISAHLKSIKIDTIINKKAYSCIKTALFFPNSNLVEIRNKIAEINEKKNTDNYDKLSENERKNYHKKDFFAYLIQIDSSTDLVNYLGNLSSSAYRYAYYEELVEMIVGKWHPFSEGDPNFSLSERQESIVSSNNKRLRVKGVAGSGKTRVVANRAVFQHLKTGDRVLIITFNISLIQYIRMRINEVRADFSTSMFEITNYHQFFRSKANQYAEFVPFGACDDKNFFAPVKEKIQKYKTIIIDEVQDFKEEWLYSIVTYFLDDGGSISVFGDGEQNIYDRQMEKETKMPSVPNFSGRWNEMSEKISLRILNSQIATLSSHFAKAFVDRESVLLSAQNEISFDDYFVKYWLVNSNTNAQTLSSNICWIMQEYKLNPSDVTVLGISVNLLRDVSAEYERMSKQQTMLTFETLEQYECLINSQPSIMNLQKDLDDIRRVAKVHFTTDCAEVKFSTIHSFKGWESKTVILLLQPEMEIGSQYKGYFVMKHENTPALLYTALTRAKCNLFILNLGNGGYHNFFNNNM